MLYCFYMTGAINATVDSFPARFWVLSSSSLLDSGMFGGVKNQRRNLWAFHVWSGEAWLGDAHQTRINHGHLLSHGKEGLVSWPLVLAGLLPAEVLKGVAALEAPEARLLAGLGFIILVQWIRHVHGVLIAVRAWKKEKEHFYCVLQKYGMRNCFFQLDWLLQWFSLFFVVKTD